MFVVSHGMDHHSILEHCNSFLSIPIASDSSSDSRVDSLNHLPIPYSWKRELTIANTRPHSSSYIYDLSNVFLSIFRISSIEYRAVYCSSSGHILEFDESMPHLEALGILDFLKSDSFSKVFFNDSTSHNYQYSRIKQPILWTGFQKNYTHFLLDDFAHRLLIKSSNVSIPSDLCILNSSDYQPAWSYDWLNTLRLPFKDISFHANVSIFRLDKLVLPVVSSLTQKQFLLSQLITESPAYLPKPSVQKLSGNASSNVVLIVNSYTLGVSRIANFESIMSAVSDHYDLIEWRPDTMSLDQKLEFLNTFDGQVRIICMGSSLMNCFLFAKYFHRIVTLVDPSTIHNKDYLFGGWAYYIPIYNLCRFVLGTKNNVNPNSAISSSYYSESDILCELNV